MEETMEKLLDDKPDDECLLEDNAELCDENGALEEELDDPDVCKVCRNQLNNPRVLSCLHEFCESCLEKIVDESTDVNGDLNIVCVVCDQTTKLKDKQVKMLPLDLISTNIIDVSECASVQCTSCSSKETAISCCQTCHNLLCSNCNSAHQFMMCFSGHRVQPLDDMRANNQKIYAHKPVPCQTHAKELLKSYCVNCQKAICAECLKQEHTGANHQCQLLLLAEKRVKVELTDLLKQGQKGHDVMNEYVIELDGQLSEFSQQCEQAKDLINESYQSYKALLEKCRDNALAQLNDMRNDTQVKIMEVTHQCEKSAEALDTACKFASRLLEKGNVVEIIYLKKYVTFQLINLISNIPKPDAKYSIEFETDYNSFETMLNKIFGRLRQLNGENTAPPEPQLSLIDLMSKPPPSLNVPCNGQLLSNTSRNHLNSSAMLSSHSSESHGSSSLTNGSPVSLPVSMQSSFDSDLASTFAAAFNVPPPSIPGPAQTHVPVLSPHEGVPPFGFSSMAEYNLQQLANLAEHQQQQHCSPAHSVPRTPAAFADLFNGDLNSTNHALNNLQALAKLTSAAAAPSNAPDNQVSPHAGLTPVQLERHKLVSRRSPNTATSCTSPISPIADYHLSYNNNTLATGMAALQINNTTTNGSLSPYNRVTTPTTNPQNYYSQPAPIRATKATSMSIRYKFGQLGPGKNQFNAPHGFCLGADEDIVVADTNNHRIQVMQKDGTFKFQFGIPGKEEGQLWYPRKVAVMRQSGKFVVCDRGNERSRMQIFTKNGHFIKKIAIRYIDIVAGLVVTAEGNIVAVDSVSPTVFILSESGDLIRWFDCGGVMREPSDIAVHGNEYYVCDFKGHNVVVFDEVGRFLRRIGGENLTNFPNGIDISDEGDILIGDSHGNRFHVAVFSREGTLTTEFECPYVKVSRCCGLKITSEGYIVTLAKNNHHVLVLNTLYIV